jgi:hypothetical protein
MQRPKWLQHWIFNVLGATSSILLGTYLLVEWLSDWKLTWYGVIVVLIGIFLIFEALNQVYKLAKAD